MSSHELIRESTQRKNQLGAICDEVFPELTQVMKNPNLPTALLFREKFPTAQALATANFSALQQARGSNRSLSDEKLLELQRLAAQSIGTKDPIHLRSLVFEQKQLLEELALIQRHIEQIEHEMIQIVEHSREGQILVSIPGIGPIQAAMIIATIGNIANFSHAAQLKSYFGWAPAVSQSGSSLDRTRLSSRGVRMMKQTMYLVVWHGIRLKDCEWNRIYERLVPIKCRYDERTSRYIGRGKVIGRLAGQIISVIFTLLKKDQETLSHLPPNREPPEPVLYDPELHRKHCAGQYQASTTHKPQKLLQLLPH